MAQAESNLSVEEALVTMTEAHEKIATARRQLSAAPGLGFVWRQLTSTQRILHEAMTAIRVHQMNGAGETVER